MAIATRGSGEDQRGIFLLEGWGSSVAHVDEDQAGQVERHDHDARRRVGLPAQGVVGT